MLAARPGISSPRLSRLARRAALGSPTELEERCELCSEPLPAEHRHVLDLQTRELLCTCRACSLLFDRGGAGGGHYRVVGDRRLSLDDLELSEVSWERLRLPVDMAFFFHSSASERVMAFYPSPMGPTESSLQLEAWQEIEAANPILASIEPDVEALLVNRSRVAPGQWLVPIEDCYRLVAVIRGNWRGFSGGKEVWLEIERFFEQLQARSRPHRQPTAAHTTEGS